MPDISKKLKLESANSQTVRLWPEGTFYKVYERSAYLFVSRLRPYEAKVLYRVMDELSLLKDWQCAVYIRQLATISKQLTAWHRYVLLPMLSTGTSTVAT